MFRGSREVLTDIRTKVARRNLIGGEHVSPTQVLLYTAKIPTIENSVAGKDVSLQLSNLIRLSAGGDEFGQDGKYRRVVEVHDGLLTFAPNQSNQTRSPQRKNTHPPRHSAPPISSRYRSAGLVSYTISYPISYTWLCLSSGHLCRKRSAMTSIQ